VVLIMVRRGVTTLAGLVLASALVSGCAQGTGDDEGGDAKYDPDAELSGELTVMGFGGEDEIGQVRLDESEAALGDVEVSLVKGDLDIQQFLSAVASGKPPDVVYAERGQIGTFASRGAILPLTDCIEGEGIDMDVFDDAAVDQVTFAGDVYGIPEFSVVQITQANADLLKQAGLTLDDVNGSDWDAVSAANKKLTRTQGGKLTVIGYDSKLPEFLPLWAKANGADMISEDGRTAQLDDPAVVEALGWAVGIYDAQGGFSKVKAFRDSADFFGSGNQFAVGSLGAMPMEQWYVNVLNDVSPDAPMAFDTVQSPDGETLAFTSGSAWGIPKGSKNPEGACRFAKTMTATDSWVKAAEKRVALREKDGGLFTGLLTANDEADDEIRGMVKPSGEAKWDQAVDAMYEANDHTFAMPANPAGEEFESAWQDGVNRVLNGQQQPGEAMAQAQKEAQAALDEAWSKWDDK
jgi:multiple sugar transport system substrate-binding protein